MSVCPQLLMLVALPLPLPWLFTAFRASYSSSASVPSQVQEELLHHGVDCSGISSEPLAPALAATHPPSL